MCFSTKHFLILFPSSLMSQLIGFGYRPQCHPTLLADPCVVRLPVAPPSRPCFTGLANPLEHSPTAWSVGGCCWGFDSGSVFPTSFPVPQSNHYWLRE
ncbi:hypothetical protein DdX_01158 [Ditylenchus destructor]|uniref:Secreted protein n=1 Tax=Ditylenchus destructor TaxID=166010 RepID=A0AAD4RDR9_9BILA|nr:hypothetical protein DdX_01158 [Ditylenchus destructor]